MSTTPDMPTAPNFSRRSLLQAGVGASTAALVTSFAGSSSADATTAGLYNKINAIDYSTTGGLAVAVSDARSGGFWQYNAPFHNECASIVKVLILATVCYRAQSLRRSLTAWEQQQAGIMIRNSDNTAATNLWNSVGGAPTVQAMANRLGMSQTVASHAWGLTTTSAYDQIVLLNELTRHGRVLLASFRTLILTLMGQVSSGQRWGVGSYGVTQVKNGWLSYNGQWRINSIGHVTGGGRNYTLAILQRVPTMQSGVNIAGRVAATMYTQLATPL